SCLSPFSSQLCIKVVRTSNAIEFFLADHSLPLRITRLKPCVNESLDLPSSAMLSFSGLSCQLGLAIGATRLPVSSWPALRRARSRLPCSTQFRRPRALHPPR